MQLLEGVRGQLSRLVRECACSTMDYTVVLSAMTGIKVKLLEDTVEMQQVRHGGQACGCGPVVAGFAGFYARQGS